MMLKAIALGAAAALVAGAAGAQSPTDPSVTTACIDVSGRALPATCRLQASRLNQREDICQCLRGGQQVTVSVCPAGVSPPAESAAYERARLKAISKGSLVGATWRGAPMCVAARNAPPAAPGR